MGVPNKMSLAARAVLRPAKFLAFRRVEGVLYVADAEKSSLHEFNGPAAIIWEMTARGCSRRDILKKITKEYDVSREVAERDIEDFLKTLEEKGLLEIVG